MISKDNRFEVDGANAAREFLKRESKSSEWDKHRLQLVWDAIALHTIGTVVFHKEPEVQACAYGIWADFQGPDRIQGNPLSWDEYDSIVKVGYLFIRRGLSKLTQKIGISTLGSHERSQREYATLMQDEIGDYI